MSDNPNQSRLNIRPHTKHAAEEEDLWDLGDLEDSNLENDDLENGDSTETSETSPSPQLAQPEEVTPSPDQKEKAQAKSLENSKGLTLVEKITLAGLCALFLGLAVSSYVWLYKKNQTTDPFAVELPFQGQYITISEFSSYWKAAHQFNEIKAGAQVIPCAQLTLKSDSSQSGALRIYFRNIKNETIGDPVTLTVKNGTFINEPSSKLTISDDGLSAEITSSDGFHQEGDFSAYALDPKLAWSIQIFEAGNADAKWDEFKKIASPKIKPLRK